MNTPKSNRRIPAIDALRGLLMVLMALDHANYFVAQQHTSGEYWGGAFPVYRDAWHFIVRFVTHFSAPGFFLLMGVGMALYARAHQQKGEKRRSITTHFLIRGLVLVALQFLLVNGIWARSPTGWGIDWYFGVLWALGVGMLLCSQLVWLDATTLLGLAGAVWVAAEIFTPRPAAWGQVFSFPTSILMVPFGQKGYWVNYPALQWIELVLLGMAVGQWIAAEGLNQRVRQRLLRTGALMLVAFLVLRVANGFGNIRPRQGQTWMDFLNVVKYPPSFTFTLLTTGTNLMLLSVLAGGLARNPLLKPLVIIGREPLFFYVTHLGYYASVGMYSTQQGTSLRFMVFYWIYGVMLLMSMCGMYAWVKRKAKWGLRAVLEFF